MKGGRGRGRGGNSQPDKAAVKSNEVAVLAEGISGGGKGGGRGERGVWDGASRWMMKITDDRPAVDEQFNYFRLPTQGFIPLLVQRVMEPRA